MRLKANTEVKFFGYKYKSPLDSYIGKFEAQMCGRRLARRTPREFSHHLFEFFSRFPSISRPQDVSVCDVEDWKIALLEEGYSWLSVRNKCCHLKTFFNYVINELDVPMTNPCITMTYLPTGPLADYVVESESLVSLG